MKSYVAQRFDISRTNIETFTPRTMFLNAEITHFLYWIKLFEFYKRTGTAGGWHWPCPTCNNRSASAWICPTFSDSCYTDFLMMASWGVAALKKYFIISTAEPREAVHWWFKRCLCVCEEATSVWSSTQQLLVLTHADKTHTHGMTGILKTTHTHTQWSICNTRICASVTFRSDDTSAPLCCSHWRYLGSWQRRLTTADCVHKSTTRSFQQES